MKDTKTSKFIKGISVCNPVDVEKEYLLYTIDYAARRGFQHFQIIGPIHNYIKGNIDGMIRYRKYEQFNDEKDCSYIDLCTDVVNEVCDRAARRGIKVYMWHHEVYLPADFKKVYPEVLNQYGDVIITHPLLEDFLKNKILDFFDSYPLMDGIVLTLHETSIPLLKLKDQECGKIERVKFITKLIYDTCASLGKTLIVRPFASLQEDYEMLTTAYEEISNELIIMDKWTQFDWNLAMPSNPFYKQIQKNPLLVEADIFGEFFGKGRLPLMLDQHIEDKFKYCNQFHPIGYVARIDRNGEIPFGDVNEVNIDIMNAHLNDGHPTEAIQHFFRKKYGEAGTCVSELMQKTETVLLKMLYIKGYLFSELSIFPSLNHCKNHYYFEMMRRNGCIDSNEWYIPKDWKSPSHEQILSEKQEAIDCADSLMNRLNELKDVINREEYHKLWVKFCNLQITTKLWYLLAAVHIDYMICIETKEDVDVSLFENHLQQMQELDAKGVALLGDAFYCRCGDEGHDDYVGHFVRDIRDSLHAELHAQKEIEALYAPYDYVICGAAAEGHHLQKEVNFSDVFLRNGELCRIPGSARGLNLSDVNSHGWFSYLVNIKPFETNTVQIMMENPEGHIQCQVMIGHSNYDVHDETIEKRIFTLQYKENEGNSSIRIRFDRNSPYVPYIYRIIVL